MLKILSKLNITLYLTLCCVLSVSAQDTQDQQLKKYQEYFKLQSLPYMQPKGCSEISPCTLVADFNDDGIIDYASLYEYSGPERRSGNRYIDLIFIYSEKNSSTPGQIIFSRVGKINNNNEILEKLEIQKKGSMQLPIGTFDLKHPGVNLIRKRKPASVYSPTYYWSGKYFYSIVKTDD